MEVGNLILELSVVCLGLIRDLFLSFLPKGIFLKEAAVGKEGVLLTLQGL